MTRREAVKLLSVLPTVGMLSGVLSAAEPATVTVQWDWEPGPGEAINYFQVFVTSGDVVPSESNSKVIRMPGDARRCVLSLPSGQLCQARVRAASAHGISAFSAPILLSV
jgi:hypothetical protein